LWEQRYFARFSLKIGWFFDFRAGLGNRVIRGWKFPNGGAIRQGSSVFRASLGERGSAIGALRDFLGFLDCWCCGFSGHSGILQLAFACWHARGSIFPCKRKSLDVLKLHDIGGGDCEPARAMRLLRQDSPKCGAAAIRVIDADFEPVIHDGIRCFSQFCKLGCSPGHAPGAAACFELLRRRRQAPIGKWHESDADFPAIRQDAGKQFPAAPGKLDEGAKAREPAPLAAARGNYENGPCLWARPASQIMGALACKKQSASRCRSSG
jgi:hypothetical protein